MHIIKNITACAAAAAILAGSGCGGGNTEGVIRVGSKNFTEQLILGELMALVIEAETDMDVKRVFNLGGTMICHGGLESGSLDVYAEYTGTALTAILKKDVIRDPEEAYEAVDRAYRERYQCDWLEPFGFNNTYAITVRESFAEEKNLDTISDLGAIGDTLTAGFTAEFMEREDGYPGLKNRYGLDFGNTMDMDPGIMYEAAEQGNVDVICAFATDGRIAAYNLQKLKDDKQFFPPYFAAPVIRIEFKEKYPDAVDALERLGGLIDDKTMRKLNYQVDEKKREPEEVAEQFLKEQGLL
ncbi:MAG: glycine betaine ABC transporter substrate-binding protein [Kiritimatiellia bacterium]